MPPHRAYAAVTRLHPGQVTEAHTHDFFETFLVLDGSGIHHWNRRKIPLQRGHLVVIRPEDAHWFSAAPREPVVFINVAVAASWWRTFHRLVGLEQGWEGAGEPRGHRLLHSQELMHLRPRLQELEDAGANPSTRLADAWMHIADLFHGRAASRAAVPEWLEAWRREISASAERLAEPIGYWQRRSGRSPEHLARSCRRYYGLTPGEVLNRARVERVKLLLRTTDAKVITIALDCGFPNLSNFHRHFLRGTGTTPALWRRSATATVPIN